MTLNEEKCRALHDALTELVALKELKKQIDTFGAIKDTDVFANVATHRLALLKERYAQRRPKAWAAAYAALEMK